MKFDIMTDVGCRRASNQDAFCRGTLPNGVEFTVLCDGMGGHRGGNVASEIAVRAFHEILTTRLSGSFKTKDLKNILLGTVVRISLLIADVAEKFPEYAGMGTTLVAVLIRGRYATAVNVGDSRAYLFRNGRLTRLTKDHSLVQEMIDRGEITPEEGENHSQRNIITRTLGYAEDCQPEILLSDVRPGDLFLLCSDGLTVPVRDHVIADILTNTEKDRIARTLVSRALACGGPDNVTVGILYEEEREEDR